MNIIIVGCGNVGKTLAKELNEEDNNITVIDLDPIKVNAITAKYDIMGVVGNGAIHTVQEQAGIDTADLLIAVTGSDELNLLCCTVAKKTGDCQTIARVKNPEFSREASFLKDELGLAMVINPELAAAEEIARVLRFPSALKIDTFAKGRVELIKFRLPESSPLVGTSIKDIVIHLHCDILFCTIERADDAYIANGSFVFEARDVISIIASPHNASVFFEKIGFKRRSVKDVIIAGGGKISRYLCEILSKSGINLKVIERRADVCNYIASNLSKKELTVIEGDATDQDLLLEEGLAKADAFVALTGIDEENILLALFAKSVNVEKTVAKINRIDYGNVINHLDLDSTIYPKNITADIIVRYVRATKGAMGSNMETLYNFIKDKVEASEFVIKADSAITNIPLSNLKFKEHILIAAILRGSKVIIPRGNDVITKGDTVVVVSEMMALGDITDVLM